MKWTEGNFSTHGTSLKDSKEFQTFQIPKAISIWTLEVKFSIKSISPLNQEIDVASEGEKIHIRMFSSIISKLFKNIFYAGLF